MKLTHKFNEAWNFINHFSGFVSSNGFDRYRVTQLLQLLWCCLRKVWTVPLGKSLNCRWPETFHWCDKSSRLDWRPVRFFFALLQPEVKSNKQFQGRNHYWIISQYLPQSTPLMKITEFEVKIFALMGQWSVGSICSLL